ncbi:MAG: PCRF domain-containing protein, partial [Pseudomonadota bacterium]
MKESLIVKLETLCGRHEEIAGLLSDIEVINDQERFRNLSMEYAQLEDVVKNFTAFREAQEALEAANEMLQEDDAEMRELAEEEITINTEALEKLEVELQKLLLPRDPNDSANVFLEIRAGTGGDEAAIFAGDLYR